MDNSVKHPRKVYEGNELYLISNVLGLFRTGTSKTKMELKFFKYVGEENVEEQINQ
jgi:hypothetical protein